MEISQNEWDAARRGCALIDGSLRALWRIVGSDRVSFLQGMLSNNVAALQPGQGMAAALLTQQGKVVSDLRVYALDEEIWLDMPAGRKAAVREALERFIVADDVEFADDTLWQPLFALEGPLAARTLLAVTGLALQEVAPLSHYQASFEATPIRVVAATHGGQAGFLIFAAATLASRLQSALLAAGAESISESTVNTLRIEAGIPWHGRDIDESTLIGEVGLTDAISFTKGCYLGQEVVERVAARGQVQKKLLGLLCDGDALPPATSKVSADGIEAGRITSATWSPALSAVIALAYIRRDYWAEGTTLTLSDGRSARVTALPFVIPAAL